MFLILVIQRIKRRNGLPNFLKILHLNNYVDLSAFNADRKVDHQDHVHEYAKEIMSLGLFYMEYQDAIREGTETEYLIVGNICKLCSGLLVIGTMLWKHSHS